VRTLAAPEVRNIYSFEQLVGYGHEISGDGRPHPGPLP
jgi:hypothetical protein